MWINLDEAQIEVIKGAMAALADDDKRAAQLFWNDAVDGNKDAREACLGRARVYEGIKNAIDEKIADFDADDPYRAVAKEQANDELEVDDDAIVSEGADPGAWVHAWIWITNDEAGVEETAECNRCGEMHPVDVMEDDMCPACVDADEDEAPCTTCGAVPGSPEYGTVGDGFDGECPSCADKTDQKENPENYE